MIDGQRRPIGRLRCLLVAMAPIVMLVAPAHAQWSSSATGSATAKSATLAPPTNLVASCGLVSASIKLTWTASVSPATTGYEVLRGTTSGNYTVSVMERGLTYTTPAMGTGTYYFVVRSTSGAWRSADAGPVSKSVLIVLFVPACV